MAQEIPDDVAFAILSKLPLKSLKRFLCVRKPWDHLLENSYFFNMFRNNFISKFHSYYQDTSLLLLHNHPDPELFNHFVMYSLSGERFQNKLKLDWPPPIQDDDIFRHGWISILGSAIHGTLCLYECGTGKAMLWNPATQEFRIIPPSPVEEPLPHTDITINLYGFGYDHVRDDYKLIRHVWFSSHTDDEGYHVQEDVPTPDSIWEIYSLRSNSWRKLDIDNELTSKFGVRDNNIYMDGVCHWLVDDDYGALLVSFNFSNEIIFTTMLPLHLRWYDNYLAVLNGSIAIISQYPEKAASFHISILGELGVMKSWTELFIVGPLPCVKHPVGTGNKGDIFFLKEDGELARFDLSTMMIEEVGVKCRLRFSMMVIYKENPLRVMQIDY